MNTDMQVDRKKLSVIARNLSSRFQRGTRNDPKFSDKLVWANSADPDQTAPRGAV